MKKLLFAVFAFSLMTSSVFARVDRYKTDVGADKTVNHITYLLPLFYSYDHTNLEGSYTLATNIGNKKSGTLSFEFNQTVNQFSKDLRDDILRVSKDLHKSPDAKVTISFELKSGERFTFDGSFFADWRNEEWHELLHVTYNNELENYVSFIMFPLEYMDSSSGKMPKKLSARYEYVLKALANSNIVGIQITDVSKRERININIPIDRPTAETIQHMQQKNTYTKERAKKEQKKEKEKSGRR